MRAHTYRFVWADVTTGRPVDDFKLRGVRWDKRISSGSGTEGGTLSGTVVLTKRLSAGRVLRVLGRSQSPHALHVWRDNQLVWSGFVTSRTPKLDGDVEMIDVQAVTWEGYTSRRTIRADLAAVVSPAQAVMNALWAGMQAPTGGNIRVSNGATGGALIDVSWYNGDAVTYADAAAKIASLGGFEWVVDYSRNSTTGVYSGALRYGSPLGQSVTPHTFVFNPGRPGNSVLGWSWEQSLDEGGTAVQANRRAGPGPVVERGESGPANHVRCL